MFSRKITRLLHSAKPEATRCFFYSEHMCRQFSYFPSANRFSKRELCSSASKITDEQKAKDDEEKIQLPSLISKRLIQSQQKNTINLNTGETDTTIDKDTLFMLDNLIKETNKTETYANVLCSRTKNLNEVEDPTISFDQKEESDFVEHMVFKDDFCAKPKPSPLLGTEDNKVPPSKVPCVGCGALLQCAHRTIPGFLPSEQFKLLSESELKTSICQRCYYIKHCDAFVEVTSKPEDYAEIISQIKTTRSLVVMVVDVMDIPGSIVPNLATYIGRKHPLLIVGNKVDLIAPDSTTYLANIKETIKQACQDAGLNNLQNILLTSAKTGFGVEKLINVLFSFYRRKADVFIVGTANAGKSSLFNTLLASDYCRHKARSLIQRATVSVWPGTTLNLLKFPIMNPTERTLALRQKRLKQDKAIMKEQLKQDRVKSKYKEKWELKEDVKMTDLRSKSQVEKDDSGKAWGQEVFAYKGSRDGAIHSTVDSVFSRDTFDSSYYQQCYWVYDTPGVINPDQTFNLLQPKESPLLQSVSVITPRCVLLKPGTAAFISGMARLDFMEGGEAMMITVHCAPDIPIQVVTIDEADEYYLQHIGSSHFGFPVGDKDRVEQLPSLVAKEFVLEGENDKMAVADIQLSSIGWVSLTPRSGTKVRVRAYTPGRKGIHLRCPAICPNFLQFKGKRISKTPFFWPKKAGLPVIGKTLEVDSL